MVLRNISMTIFRDQEMNLLTHRIGIEPDIPDSKAAEHRRDIENIIRSGIGIVRAEFCVQQPDVVVIEYDPGITTSFQIHKILKKLNGRALRRIFL